MHVNSCKFYKRSKHFTVRYKETRGKEASEQLPLKLILRTYSFGKGTCTYFTLIVSTCVSSRKMAKHTCLLKYWYAQYIKDKKNQRFFCHVFQIMTEDSLRGCNLFKLQDYYRDSPSLIVIQRAFDTREHLSFLGRLLNVSSHNWKYTRILKNRKEKRESRIPLVELVCHSLI